MKKTNWERVAVTVAVVVIVVSVAAAPATGGASLGGLAFI